MFRRSSGAKRGVFDSDGISLITFDQQKQKQLDRISRSIKTSSYYFSDLTPFAIPKSNGKERIICVPTVTDRIVQRAIYQYLQDKGYDLANPISFGFVKGRSVQTAVLRGCQLRTSSEWVLRIDISAFFDNIKRGELKEKLRCELRSRSLFPLLERVIDCEVSPTGSVSLRRLRELGIHAGKGLRQGMPLSPYLANLYLSKFDSKVSQGSEKLVRYADDIIAFANSRAACEQIFEMCEAELATIGLRVHPLGTTGKTEIIEPSRDAEFLGVVIRKYGQEYKPAVTNAQINTIRQKFGQYDSVKKCVARGSSISRLFYQLDSLLNAYIGTYEYCANRESFKDQLVACRNGVLSSIFKELGISGQPSRLVRTFLGIQ